MSVVVCNYKSEFRANEFSYGVCKTQSSTATVACFPFSRTLIWPNSGYSCLLSPDCYSFWILVKAANAQLNYSVSFASASACLSGNPCCVNKASVMSSKKNGANHTVATRVLLPLPISLNKLSSYFHESPILVCICFAVLSVTDYLLLILWYLYLYFISVDGWLFSIVLVNRC